MILATVVVIAVILVALFAIWVPAGLIGLAVLSASFLLRPVRRFTTRFTQSATYRIRP